MRELELSALTYVLNSLWQVPLIVAAAWVAARLARDAGPRTEHRIWVTALLLEAILPACNFQAGDVWRMAASLLAHGGAAQGEVRTVLGPGLVEGAGALHLPELLIATLLLAYLAGAIYFAGRLAWGLGHTARMLRGAKTLPLEGPLGRSWQRASTVLDATSERLWRKPEIAESAMTAGPVTLGVRRRVLLVPPGFLDSVSSAELDALLAHEFAHMVRHDFAKNMAYSVVSLPVAYHPMAWLTRARVAESRELVCDGIAAEVVAGRESYARALLRLAARMTDGGPARVLPAMGIFDGKNFERRISMLTEKRVVMGTARRLLVAAACGAVALAACTSALALRMHVDGVAAAVSGTDAAKTTGPITGPITVPGHAMQGNRISGPTPKYPKAAKEVKIQGTVLLNALIGKNGKVQQLKVVSGPKQLRQSALDAVNQWIYKPYLLNGDPVAVKTEIRVIYSLQK